MRAISDAREPQHPSRRKKAITTTTAASGSGPWSYALRRASARRTNSGFFQIGIVTSLRARKPPCTFLYRLFYLPGRQIFGRRRRSGQPATAPTDRLIPEDKFVLVSANFQFHNCSRAVGAFPEPGLAPFANPLQLNCPRGSRGLYHFFQSPATHYAAFFHNPNLACKTPPVR